jgi:ubiquinone/menaquinone biosynthesis C-methylase UbiE
VWRTRDDGDGTVTDPEDHRHVGGNGPSPDHSHMVPARVLNAVSLVFGRGAMAKCVADVARLTPADRVVDIGCGPGTAVRVASRRCERATGVDPDPTSRRLARWLNTLGRRHNVQIVEGSAEALPLPDDSATVVWSITAVHHWTDRAAGLAEALRVLVPGGRVFLAERMSPPGARGHKRHGLTEAQLDNLEQDTTRAGFTAVRSELHATRRDTIAVVRGSAALV